MNPTKKGISWEQCYGNLFISFSWVWFSKILLIVSLSSDGETFISADDLRINLWNLEISNQSFNIVDVKPANMEDLTGKVTSYLRRDVQLYSVLLCAYS